MQKIYIITEGAWEDKLNLYALAKEKDAEKIVKDLESKSREL